MFESIATAPAPTVRVHPPLPSRAFGVASKEREARTALQPTRMDALNRLTTKEERLPFWVRLVRNEADLRKAVHIRHAAYARHVPDLAHQLQEPEATDYEDGVVVLLAESKLDGSPWVLRASRATAFARSVWSSRSSCRHGWTACTWPK